MVKKNVLVITDQYSGYIEAVPLLRKSDSKDAVIERILFYERQLQPLLVTALMSDHGGQFDNSDLQEWCLGVSSSVASLTISLHPMRQNQMGVRKVLTCTLRL
jgi:transposase InsO family protein